MNASAARLAVDDLAERVRAAGILARVHAAVLQADRVHRAVLGTGTVAFRLAAGCVRIAHATGRTLAHRIARGTSDAERGRVTGIRTARLHGDALDVGHRVRPITRRTLARRFVIVGDTDGVYAARVLVTGIVTGVREPVAELRQRAVDVVDTRHRSTAGRRIVGVAGVEPGRALAVRHVVVDDAEGVRAARDKVAD